MITRTVAVSVALVTSFGLLTAPVALAQDAAKVAPDVYKVVLENASVRVLEVHAKAGQKVATHSHPDSVIYHVTAAKLKFGHPDGKTVDQDAKAGDILFAKAETHTPENAGKEDAGVLVVELLAGADKPQAAMPKGEDAGKSPGVKVILDNDRVRVLDVHIPAGAKVPMHVHPDNLVYCLSEGKLKFTDAEGKSTEKDLAKGAAVWSGPMAHAAENVGKNEVHVLHFEIKPPAAAKHDEKKDEKKAEPKKP